MPIVSFHLTEGRSQPEQQARLLTEASQLYAQVLQSPLERVRAYIHSFPETRVAVAGVLARDDAPDAPYFEFFVLDGRPFDQCSRLMGGFTDLLVRILGARRDLIRGCCRRIDPQDWSIGGVPASVLRAAEIDARARAAAAAPTAR
ncbi:MAG: tautomerase family protein [Gammaproteobacteria bacterium]|nr:tautomerase family protein [Gammaproteobacteria bacterium]